MNTLKLAEKKDIEIYKEILDDGRAFQREQGFIQWTDDYPNLDTIREDIQKSRGYVLKIDESIAGYMCIDFSGEPAYENIDGEWRVDEPYAVVHRIAFSKEFAGRGLSDVAFRLIEDVCKDNNVFCIRIDTDFPNKRMQHILTKNGYEYCGVVLYEFGDRMAYDKILK